MQEIQFTLNDKAVTAQVEPGLRLVDLLRDGFGLCGTKEACGQGECGACTVLVDQEAVHSCLLLAVQAHGREIVTVEGLSKNGKLDPLQEAFVDAGAVQCGFCTPGMLLSAKGLLLRNPDPSDQEILEALEGNLCRCTGYVKIVEAVRLAVERGKGAC